MDTSEKLNLNDVAERVLAGAERVIAGAERFAAQRAERRAQAPPAEHEFRDAVRARSPRAVVTPALIALNIAVYVLMLFRADGSIGDPKTMLEWGASFGPRTTNGEWWRLVTSMFVHTGFIHLLVNMAALAQAGLVLERLVGRPAFVTTYFSAGIVAAVVRISDQPLAVSSGASAAVFGVYGLLVASFLAGMIGRSATSIPLPALKRFVPAAGVFLLYSMLAGGQAHLTGLSVGFGCGCVLAIGVSISTPSPRRVALVGAAVVVAAIVIALPLRGIADVRPEIARIAALEDRVMSRYEKAIDRFKKGTLQPEALAKLIEKEILPDLAKARARIEALSGVPRQQQPVVTGALEYFRLRQDSFRMRTEAIRKASLVKLRQAEGTEAAARQALDKLRPIAEARL
jgi:rhomboid protease GluP